MKFHIEKMLLDENSPKYKCCCGCMHVKNGAKLIGRVELASAILLVLSALANSTNPTYKIDQADPAMKSGNSVQFASISLVFTMAIVFPLLYGIKYERKSLLIPHLIVQILGIIVSALTVIMILVAVGTLIFAQEEFKLTEAQHDLASTGLTLALAQLIALGFGLAFQVWWFVVIVRVYRYFSDKEVAACLTAISIQAMPAQQEAPVSLPQRNTDYAYDQPPPTYECAATSSDKPMIVG